MNINKQKQIKMKTEEKLINVAPSSDEGHFVKGTENVVMLDEITESFHVKGESKLVTKNHTDLEMKEDCLVTCQMVYDPFAKSFERVRD